MITADSSGCAQRELKIVLQYVAMKINTYNASLEQEKPHTCSLFVCKVHSPLLVKKKMPPVSHLFTELASRLEQLLNGTQHSWC
jgi:hypothetical protein